MSTDNSWELDEIPPRNKLLSFIVERVKAGATKEQLDTEIPEYIKDNDLPDFPKWDIISMRNWAIRKFSPSHKDKDKE